MSDAPRMPRYDIRNDGMGPYAAFYCDRCDREYRSQPDVAGTVATDVGRQAAGNLLRGIPIFGRAVADTVNSRDQQRYSTTMTPQQLEKAWAQVQDRFRECPTCGQIVCLSDFDLQTGYCQEDSPRANSIAEAQAEQAAGVMQSVASAFGITGMLRQAAEAAKAASAGVRCPKDGTVAPAGTKFCPQCGSAMEQVAPQPAAQTCQACGAPAGGAKFCPQCGTKIEVPAPVVCSNCGLQLKEGAKFCPECGTRAG